MRGLQQAFAPCQSSLLPLHRELARFFQYWLRWFPPLRIPVLWPDALACDNHRRISSAKNRNTRERKLRNHGISSLQRKHTFYIPMKPEPTYETMFQALVEIKKHLDETVTSLNDQIQHAQIDSLESAFAQQRELFLECLEGIDEHLLKLSVYVEECQNLYNRLISLNEKISELRGAGLEVPERVAGNTLIEVLAGRLDQLKSEGKI